MELSDIWKGWLAKMLWAGTTVVLGTLGYLVYPIGWGVYWDINQPETGLKAQISSHLTLSQTAIDDAQADRDQINARLAKIQESLDRDYYLTGTGSVGTFGGSEKYARVNRRSDARIYKDGDRMRVTCEDVEGKPEAILTIRGTFSDDNSDLLISFSKEAADDLGITGRVKVDLEPEDK